MSISMTMLLSSRRTRRAVGAGETATGSGSDDTGPTGSNIVHSDDEGRRATLVARRPPSKRRAAAVSAWRSALYSLGAMGKSDASPSHIKSLPNRTLVV